MYNFIKEHKYILIISAINFIVVFASSFTPGYGYFIDEFYYIACANNPAFGYVDHPPLAPLILMLYKSVFGLSLPVLRLFPAIASSVTVFLVGFIAKLLGGNRASQVISALAVLLSPLFLVVSSIYSMNVFEPLLIAIAMIFILKMLNQSAPKYWLHISVVFGLLLMNKHTSIMFIVLFPLFLLLSSSRKLLFSKYFFTGILILFLIILPNIIWQFQYNFPSLEFYRNITTKNFPLPLTEFLTLQAFAFNPFIVILCFAGAIYFLFSKKYGNYKTFALIFLFSILIFFLLKNSRVDRMIFTYLIAIPIGAVFLGQLTDKLRQKWILYSLCVPALAFMLMVTPVLVPYLNYENSEKLTGFLGINVEMEKGKKPRIHQLLSDRVGWEERADIVGKAFGSLSEGEKEKTIVAGEYYGIAGAIEFYGRKYGINKVVCGHNNYYLWSKSRLDGDIVLQITNKSSYSGLLESYNSVDSTGLFYDNEFCSPEGRNQTVFICRNPKHSKEELLDGARFFY